MRSGLGEAGGGGRWALGRVTETLEARTWVEDSVLGIPEELFALTFLPFFFSFPFLLFIEESGRVLCFSLWKRH